ncbi:TetR family transcriptional regulator [Streptomyces sp. NPDC054975]
MTLAQRKRQLVSDELTEAALQLLAVKGFDTVTVDEIVAAAGVSKRTFFRYFASKEDVVVQFLADLGTGIRAELAARPADEPPSLALRHAMAVPFDLCTDHPDHTERALRVVRLILDTPSLHARFLERRLRWSDDLAAELTHRLRLHASTDLYPRLAAGAALTAFDVTLQQWSAAGGADDPGALIERAFALLAPALDAHPAPAPLPSPTSAAT